MSDETPRQARPLFVLKLEEKRRDLKLNNHQFAAEIGVSPGIWSRVKNGKRGISRKMARRVITRWPEFSGYHTADLLAVAA